MSAPAVDGRTWEDWRRVWHPGPPIGPVTRTGAGPWDEVTRGFWTGGLRITADELRPGDVYRWGTLSGWRVTAVDRGHYGHAVTILVTVDGWEAPRVFSPGQPLELERAGCPAERNQSGVTRRCGLDRGHADDHESWSTGPAVTAGLIWR